MSQTEKLKKPETKAKAKASLNTPTAKKPSTKAKLTPKKLTLAEMQKALTSLETRMKRADTLTQKSVKTLEDVVSTLDTRTRKDSTSQKSALSRRVGKLSNQLEEGMAETRAEIKAALASALSNPNPSSVKMAVSEALTRLETNEAQQAQAIAKINRHLANLAKAVEERIVKDQIAATEALHAIETRLSTRLESIENDTASALTKIGNKVEDLSQAIDDRQSRADSIVALKISELAAQTQTEFDKATNSIEERLENLERAEREAALVRPEGLSADMSVTVSELSGQVETLRSRLDSIDASFTALQTQTEIMSQDLLRTQSQLQEQAWTAPYQNPTIGVPSEGHTPAPAAAPTNVVNFTPPQPTANPYAAMQSASAQQPQAVEQPVDRPKHFPVEFDPNAFVHTNVATAYAEPENFIPTPMPRSEPTTYESMMPQQPVAAPPPLVGGMDLSPQYAQGPVPFTDVDSIPTGDPLLPYAEPAYAESTEHMDTMRITESGKPRKLRVKKEKTPKIKGESAPLLTSRNLRIAALATGVAVIGLFAAKTFMTPNNEPLLVTDPQAPQFEQPVQFPVEGETAELGSTPPIGQYAETATPIINANEAGTIETAAANGNAVAEFQLGLSYLETNRVDEGVSLIRNAANTLPAAQYRLAKLYETGTGVEKNTAMAKDLTERAARAGNRIAMHDLAIYYAYGNGGVDIDMVQAAGWFEKAAERGVVDSQFNLAILFENGQGVTPSPADAYFWYMIASTQGDQTAKARLLALDEILAPADIQAAKTRAANFTPVKINQAANGIFKDLPWNSQGQKTNNNAQRAQIRQVQTLLAEVGFNVGAADGIMGKRTREAITTFERTNGMDQTGEISAALIEKLSIAAGA